jgi:hypothetical protein
VSAQDRSPLGGVDLHQPHLLAAASAQHGPAAGGTQVLHPVRAIAEHGHQIPLSLVLGHHDRERDQPP